MAGDGVRGVEGMRRMARETFHRVVVRALLWIWISLLLYASQGVGYMGNTLPVVFYIALLLGAQFIPGRVWRGVLLIGMVLALLKWEYYPWIPWLPPQTFLISFGRDFAAAVVGVLSGRLQAITDGVRTLAFLGVVTFGTLLLEEIVQRPRWILLITVLGEFSLVDIGRSFGVHDQIEMALFLFVALALLTVMNLPRLQTSENSASVRDWLLHLIAPLGLSVAMVAGGLIIPKAAPSWPAPRQLLYRLLQNAHMPGASAAYGANDSQLGGPFAGTHAVLLRIFAAQPSYYQGETLATYTGTGWLQAPADNLRLRSSQRIPASVVRQIGPQAGAGAAPTTERVKVVRGTYPVLFGGYQITRVTPPAGFRHYTLNETADAVSAGVLTAGESYTVRSSLVRPTAASLQNVHDGNLAYALPQYLELPTNFPRRDIALARRITAGKQGTYAKVEAIIQYLQTHETYHLHVAYVPPGKDFVDQFLFVTHRGYCDYFSSALAVLSRAVGIPSRWVKGFVAVPPDPNYHGPGNEYVLRGTDAHSWADIWFAGHGWVPFEATPSFVLPAVSTQATRHAQTQVAPAKAKSHPAQPPHGHAGAPKSVGGWRAPKIGRWWEIGTAGAAGLLAILLAALWAARRKTRPAGAAERAQVLLARLFRLFGPREEGQTLREYARSVADADARADVLRFVIWYEKVCYSIQGGTAPLGEGHALLRHMAHAHRRSRRSGTRAGRKPFSRRPGAFGDSSSR